MGSITASPHPAAVEGHTAAIVREAQDTQAWWREQWLAFPTVAEHDGVLDFWPRGERLARETIAQMRRFPEGASVLRRILARLDHDSTVAQGFVNHLEEVLARPDLYPPAPSAGN